MFVQIIQHKTSATQKKTLHCCKLKCSLSAGNDQNSNLHTARQLFTKNDFSCHLPKVISFMMAEMSSFCALKWGELTPVPPPSAAYACNSLKYDSCTSL